MQKSRENIAIEQTALSVLEMSARHLDLYLRECWGRDCMVAERDGLGDSYISGYTKCVKANLDNIRLMIEKEKSKNESV